jgi:hypothetical protein
VTLYRKITKRKKKHLGACSSSGRVVFLLSTISLIEPKYCKNKNKNKTQKNECYYTKYVLKIFFKTTF